ncbi:hypothetical protein CCR75_005413 [Bremia lactucae]|uniref:HEAT repeat-containing protein 1 n=1 Tax=Bremia lactucae TaxID=4779 RepID=A0A976IDJ9_BRELC|nr:hypothetical protein CCR75_005413 [Bremia lactucae]
MASALARQLQQLREAGAGSKRRTDTFVYDQREAARLDDETVYNLAWNGLLELKKLDARFEALDADAQVAKLFSSQRIHFHRAKITSNDEKELDTALEKVLDALSAYFLLGAAHHVLEFLVRRYEVHRHNVDAVMAMIIAYHESSWFIRMVRILHIHNTRWEFMLGVKTQGAPLLRAALVQRVINESSVIEFVFDAATRIGANNPKLTSLYTLVVLQVLEQGKVTEIMLRWLIPQLLMALKSIFFPELQSSAYMIVTKLASKATLSSQVVDALVKSLIKNSQSGAQLNALLCVIFLAQTQPSFSLSERAGIYLVRMENVEDFLIDAASNYASTKFMQQLIFFLTKHTQSTDDEFFHLLAALIDNNLVADEGLEELVKTMIQQAHNEDFAMNSARVQAISQSLVALSKKTASEVDVVVNSMLSQQTKKSKNDKKLNCFLSKTFENVANSAHFVSSNTDANTSLALALDHPTEHIRYQALVSLAKIYDTKAETVSGKNQVLNSGDVLVRRFLDDSKRIACFMVSSSLGDMMVNLSTKQEILIAIAQAARKWNSRGDAVVVQAVVDFALQQYRKKAVSSDIDENLLTLLVSLLDEKCGVSVEAVWSWMSALNHPFVQSDSKLVIKTLTEIADKFGLALADNIQDLLPYCLRWSQESDYNEIPLTAFLIETLSAARAQLASKKPRSKKTKEQQLFLDQAFLILLKKEFARLCNDPASEAQGAYSILVASKMTEIAYDIFTISRDDFDVCVATLLESPIAVFIRMQECLLDLFHAKLEAQLLPTMARIVTKPAIHKDVPNVLAKTRSLDIISAVLEGISYETQSEELRQLVIMVPVVMAALSDKSKSVRQSAVACLDRWIVSLRCGNVKSSQLVADVKTLKKASEFLLKSKQDILMDSNSVVSLCGTYSTHADSSSFYQLLMDFVSSASSDEIGVAVKLLELLAPVKLTLFWEQSVDFFQQALSGCLASSADGAMCQLLTSFLAHYLNSSVAITVSKQGKQAVSKKCLGAILAILCPEKETIPQQLKLYVADNLTADFYNALDDVSRHVLVGKLLHLLMVAEGGLASKLITCMKKMCISYGIFAQLLEEQLLAQAEPYSELSCILEVLAIKVGNEMSHENVKTDLNKLLATLCNVLALLCDSKHESVVSEYILQVLFGCLRRICEISSSSRNHEKKGEIKATKYAATLNPDLLVKHTLACLSRSSSSQTRNEALLFMSSLVDLHPASILTSLDKILGFVSADSMRHEDEYSFYVLETIIKAVVPHIVASESKQSAALITPQRFVGLFVAAFDQISKMRVEPLFRVVVKTLGSNLLPYCAVELLQCASLDKDSDVQRERIQFAHNLCYNFDCVEQVSSLAMILRFARDLFPHVVEEADTDTDDADDDDDDVEYNRFVFDKRLVNSTVLSRRLNLILVKFVAAHLRAKELHCKIVVDQSNNDDDNNMLQQKYLMLAQLDLVYFRRVAREQSRHDDEHGFWTSLASHSMDVIGALQQLLSTPGFVAVISELLHHDNSLVRKKAMQLFNERLQEDCDALTFGEALLFIDMLDEFDAILRNTQGLENSANIQTALLSVDILARYFAADHAKRFQHILPTIITYLEHDVSNSPFMTLHLSGCAFVCLSSICRAAGPMVLPLLPKFFPRLLSGIEYCTSSANSISGIKSVLQCLLKALEVFTDKIPQFLGPHLPAVIRALLTPSLLSSAPMNAEVLLSVDCCFLNLCNHVELRQLLPVLFGAYENVLTLKSDTSVTRLFAVVGTVVSNLGSSSVRKHLPSFARFFVTTLDARRVHLSKLEDLEEVEEVMLNCFVQFILKLSEKQLKPLFFKLVEWVQARIKSSDKLGDISRRISFFKLVVKLSERLRGIFVPYYAHILELLTLALRESCKSVMQKPPRSFENNESEDDDFFTSNDEPAAKRAKTRSISAADMEAERNCNVLLLTTAVRALDGCFVHDNDGFTEKDRFDMVLAPLVDVLDVLKYDATMREFVLETVAPCLANLAWAAKSDILWKPLHYAVLMKSRGECALVRLAALVTVEKCYQVIGDEFLAMLPESIPFLAEFMEDTNDEVEKTCHRVIKQIEDISGESLDQYLTT